MHRQLRELLQDAEGESHFVISANIDIRGFSSFFSDSTQAAAYLSSAYTKILANYFPTVSFLKPTGDGLLLVVDVTRETLKQTVRDMVAASLQLEKEFSKICEDDALINYATPERVGIGIARGTATRIRSGEMTLDYSGVPLNLASRLMDLARPNGVVFSGDIGIELVGEEIGSSFTSQEVYVKGIAETESITIYTTRDVVVPDVNRRPIGAKVFLDKAIKTSLKLIRDELKGASQMVVDLKHRPVNPESLQVGLTIPGISPSGRRTKGSRVMSELPGITYTEDVGNPQVSILYSELVKILEIGKVKPTWEVELRPRYSVALGIAEPEEAALEDDN